MDHVNKMIANFDCPINTFQQAVIGAALCLSSSARFVSVVVGYGKGKSSCYFGVALYLAAKLKKKVLVLYANKGLQKKDRELLESMSTYCNTAYIGFDKLVRFEVGLKRPENFKPDFVLLDESDHLIFEKPLEFFKLMLKWNVGVVGFTAKEFVGDGLISEKDIFKAIGFVTLNTTTEEDRKLLSTD